MSHKTVDVAYKPWRFDLVSEATGVGADYAHHEQIALHLPYSTDVENIRTVSLQHDDGLKTQIINSLFLDRRAEPDDPGYSELQHDLRGWLADGFFIEGDRWGSKLWLLSYIGVTSTSPDDAVLKWAKAWTEQALQWLIADGVASRIDVTTWYPKPERIRIHVALFQNDNLIYNGQWEAFRDDVANSNT